jgi:DNA invertase Pin-like site-specific DNA recombinase
VDDLRRVGQTLTGRGVHIEFVKEHLTHVKTDVICPGVIHEFDRALIKEQQREEIALAKKRGAFKGRKKSLSHAVFIQERSLRDREKRQ